MKKRNIFLLLSLAMVLFTFIYVEYQNNQYQIDEEDLTLIVPNKQCQQLEEDLLKKSKKIISIINKDPKDGYTIGLGTPSLSKEGVKKIYDYLKQEKVCIADEQGYFDLENREIFEEFWNFYLQDKDCSFTYYIILQTGQIRRTDYYYDHQKFYAIHSDLNLDNINAPIVDNIYGKQMEDVHYEDGFFYYRFLISDTMKRFGMIEHEYIRIAPLGEKNRAYKQKYIGTIDYQCTNIFTTNWNRDTIDKVNFSDLYEYLYELKNNTPYYAEETYDTSDSFIKEIPSHSFETLIQEYFDISSSKLRQYCVYNQESDAYPWREAYCVPSKFETPCFIGDVIDVDENDHSLMLTVYVNGYEYGYSYGFTHQIAIEKTENGFHYIGNQLITTSDDHLPKYMPGVTCQ